MHIDSFALTAPVASGQWTFPIHNQFIITSLELLGLLVRKRARKVAMRNHVG